jgi:hypothetical protein
VRGRSSKESSPQMSMKYVSSIDEILGDRKTRYFGDGYTEVRQALRWTSTERGDGMQFDWQAAIEFPLNWSSKAGTQQSPHLSTIDVLELALQCARSIPERGPRIAWLRSGSLCEIDITAGKSPVEGDLSAIPVTGTLQDSKLDHRSLELRIANMDVLLAFSTVRRQSGKEDYPQRQLLSVRDVLLHMDDPSSETLVSSAIVEPMSRQASAPWSPSSCFAATLQLGQALLYEMDGIHRSETNTLWMKRTRIKLEDVSPSFIWPQPIHTRLDNVRRYTKADGDWRRADVIGRVANMEVMSSVTHKLPAAPKEHTVPSSTPHKEA